MPTPDAPREELLIACVTDDGEVIAPEIADKMFMVPGENAGSVSAKPDEAKLEALQSEQFSAFSDRVKRENFEWIEAEEERLDRYAADIEIELDALVDTMEAEIKELQRQKRSPDLSMEQKLELSRKIKKLQGDVDDTKLSKFERRMATVSNRTMQKLFDGTKWRQSKATLTLGATLECFITMVKV